jgi:predicted anti-sigma-YlaC factor YlaD
MRCDEARERLSASGYGTVPDVELQAHVAACDACRAAQAAELSLDALLANDEPHLPGPGFDTRFFARLDAERARSRRRRWAGFGFALVPIAAAVALIVMRREEPSVKTQGTETAAAGVVTSTPTELAQEDLELALDLELIEELDLVQRIDELEAFETLADVDERELDALLKETP